MSGWGILCCRGSWDSSYLSHETYSTHAPTFAAAATRLPAGLLRGSASADSSVAQAGDSPAAYTTTSGLLEARTFSTCKHVLLIRPARTVSPVAQSVQIL